MKKSRKNVFKSYLLDSKKATSQFRNTFQFKMVVMNKFMHPRNPYRKKKPDFKALAIKYKEFRDHATTNENGKVQIDFKDPESLRALSWALLKEDFGLDVEMPLDRLIPTIPLRLNYILWVEDIVGRDNVKGIDIGCGSSCIYPLLGAKMNDWNFVATDVDGQNIHFAKKNIRNNDLESKIEVIEVGDDVLLHGVIKERSEKFDFCMCNPPFFANNLEAYSLTTTRKPDERSEPNSINTAEEVESITDGGEIAFVTKIIMDSIKLRDKVKVYTTMLGKKSSVGKLKQILGENKIKNISSYEFAQGKTMRYGLAWTFHDDLKFPVSPFQESKVKGDPKYCYIVPDTVKSIEYSVEKIGKKLEDILKTLQITTFVLMTNKFVWSVEGRAFQNTWSHQRRKRRQGMTQNSSKIAKTDLAQKPCDCEINVNDKKTESVDVNLNRNVSPDLPKKNEISPKSDSTAECPKGKKVSIAHPSASTANPVEYLIVFWLTVRKKQDSIEVEIQWRDGKQKECLHQILQHIKNQLV
ncbi:U6 small nuclear RNA (adenine-(43)-N(6))-methyltransferase-like [Tubulanus polymorphus]|uniref:U6 small nuclear RNA (adenine-(43)-N(6))-methyltransferase-like n=1 Tax=Tubulanus polymorphus TaxID=672921 RepID=UPI003DA575A8